MFACMLDCHEESPPPWLEDACAIEKACTVKTVRLLQVAKKVCRMWRVVVLVSTKYVHVACFTGSRLSQSFAASEVMFMVLIVLYNGFFSN